MVRSLPKSTLERFPEHVKAIGMVSIEIGNLDMRLGELLAALLMLPTFLGQAVYFTPRAAIGRIEVVENVIRITTKPGTTPRRTLEALMRRAKAVVGKRHAQIHHAWGVSKENSDEIRSLPLPAVADTSGKEVSLAELNRLIEDIRQLTEDLEKPIHDLRELWPPTEWEKRGAPSGA